MNGHASTTASRHPKQINTSSAFLRKMHEAPGVAAEKVGKRLGWLIHKAENVTKKLVNETVGKPIFQVKKTNQYSVKIGSFCRNLVNAAQYTCQLAAKIVGTPSYVLGYLAGRTVGLAVGAAIVGGVKLYNALAGTSLSTRSINAYSSDIALVTSAACGFLTSGAVSYMLAMLAPAVGIPLYIGTFFNMFSELDDVVGVLDVGYHQCKENRKANGWPPMQNMSKFIADHDPWVHAERKKTSADHVIKA